MRKLSFLSLIFMAIGLVLCLVSLVGCGFDFEKMEKVTEKNFTITEEITDILINADGTSCNITVKAGDSEKTELFVKNKRSVIIDYTITDGKLTVNATKKNKLSIFDMGTNNEIILTLNKKDYESLDIQNSTGKIIASSIELSGEANFESSTGDINISSIRAKSLSAKATTGDISGRRLYSAEKMDFSVSTGEISLEEINATVFTSKGEIEIKKATLGAIELMKVSTGDIDLDEVYTSGTANIETSTGDVEIENSVFVGKLTANGSTGDFEMTDSDAYELEIEFTTGDVTLILLSPKNFVANSSTGKIDVIGTVYTAPLCKITTTTGDVTVRIAE